MIFPLRIGLDTYWPQFRSYKKGDPLLPSGFLGPVTVIPAQGISFQP